MRRSGLGRALTDGRLVSRQDRESLDPLWRADDGGRGGQCVFVPLGHLGMDVKVSAAEHSLSPLPSSFLLLLFSMDQRNLEGEMLSFV